MHIVNWIKTDVLTLVTFPFLVECVCLSEPRPHHACPLHGQASPLNSLYIKLSLRTHTASVTKEFFLPSQYISSTFYVSALVTANDINSNWQADRLRHQLSPGHGFLALLWLLSACSLQNVVWWSHFWTLACSVETWGPCTTTWVVGFCTGWAKWLDMLVYMYILGGQGMAKGRNLRYMLRG